MMSFRAMRIFTLVFVLLGCSHTLHNNYPPPHPPGTVLDLSSIQEPVVQTEQLLIESPPPQIQEKPQETIRETPRVNTPVQKKVPIQKKKPRNNDYEINSQVQFWVDRLSNKDRDEFLSALSRLDRIRPTMEQIFKQHGIPKDLVYLCLVESDANPHAVSCSGAAGYWQFIPDTAKKYGLQVNKYVDERKHLEKSTHAAAQYLRHLYSIFGDWYLSIAAYNAGEGAVLRLMKTKGVYTFWDINNSMDIKLETIEYVPKFIATVIIAKDRNTYGLPVPDSVHEPAVPDMMAGSGYLGDINSAGGSLRGSFAGNTLDDIPDTIPASIKDMQGKVHKNAERSGKRGIDPQTEIPDKSPSYVTHTVRKGDTLYSLAKKYSIRVEAIAKANRISDKQNLQIGKTIVIPVFSHHEIGANKVKQDNVHIVAQGETLKEISREHGVLVSDVIHANAIKDPGRIKPKMTLVIPSSSNKHAAVKATKYKVKKGDTLWGISKQFDVSTMDILRWNRLASTTEIKPGDKLTIYHQ